MARVKGEKIGVDEERSEDEEVGSVLGVPIRLESLMGGSVRCEHKQ